MTRKLLDAVTQQKKSTQQTEMEILGSVGALIDGQRIVEVPNRNSFIYIRLQDNSNEIIQAFNNQVSPSYNLPVKLVWKDNRYIVLGVDTVRYQNNWPSFAPYLPRHGTQHSFSDPPGGDVAWIYSRQFMPMLPFPSGSNGASQLIINSSVYRNPDGTWEYIGGSGTADLTLPKPTDSQARMLLLYWDLDTGSPASLTGSFFSASITGTSQVLPYIPALSDSQKIPLVGVRLVSGTSSIGWDNIYDVRQFAVNVPPAFAGGFGIWDEGVPQGTGTILNFIGEGVTVTVSGTVARILVTASAGGGGDSVWTTGTAGTLSITTKDSTNDSRGNRALSHGNNTLALAANDHSEGSGSIASGTNSHAEGQSTLTRGQASHAEGISTKAVGLASHAEGVTSIASGTYSHAEGEENIAFGYASHVAGGYNEAHGNYSAIIAGILNSVVGEYSSVLAGQGITGSADNTAYTDYMNVRSLGTGTSIQNVGIDANGFLVPGTSSGGGIVNLWVTGSAGTLSIKSLGGGNESRGDYSLSHGSDNNANGQYSHSEGNFTTASGTSSHSEGSITKALGEYSHSEGRITNAAGDASHSEGFNSTASGTYSHAEGDGNIVYGYASHVGGRFNTVRGDVSSIIAGVSGLLIGTNSSITSGDGVTGTADNTTYADYMNVRRLRDESAIANIGISASGFLVTGTEGGGGGVQLSTASPIIITGSTSYSKPAGLEYVIVEIVGGGGGGGGVDGASTTTCACGNGGGAGEYAKKKILAADLSASETVTIGAGGAGGAAGNNVGSNGGTTSFGTHLTAGGGNGGGGQGGLAPPFTGAAAGGSGGSGGTGGGIHVVGNSAIQGALWTTAGGTLVVSPSIGGGNPLAGQAKSSTAGTTNEAGVNGNPYGGGAGGARVSGSTDNFAGGDGAQGVCIIWEYVTS